MSLVVGEAEDGDELALDAPFRSIHCLGVPGMGKSHLLVQLAIWYASAGAKVLLLDIKDGTVAKQAVTTSRLPLERLTLFAPGLALAAGVACHLNLLAGPVEEVIDNFWAMLKRTGDVEESFTLVKKFLTMALGLALRQPHPVTLADVLATLTNPAVRARMLVVPLPKRLREQWAEFEAQMTAKGPSAQLRKEIDSTLNRLDPWLTRERLATLLSHPTDTLNLAAEREEGQLIVCDLVSGVSAGQTLRLGNLLMGMVMNAAVMRERESPPWVVVADEFDLLASDFFRDSLDKLRSRGLSIVAAHQHLGQLSPGLASSFLSVPIKLYFKPSPLDVPQLQRLYPGTGEMWRTLRKYQVAVLEEPAGEPDELDWWVGADWGTGVLQTGWQIATTAAHGHAPDVRRWQALVPQSHHAAKNRRATGEEAETAHGIARQTDEPQPPGHRPATAAHPAGDLHAQRARSTRLADQPADRAPLVSWQPDF